MRFKTRGNKIYSDNLASIRDLLTSVRKQFEYDTIDETLDGIKVRGKFSQ